MAGKKRLTQTTEAAGTRATTITGGALRLAAQRKGKRQVPEQKEDSKTSDQDSLSSDRSAP